MTSGTRVITAIAAITSAVSVGGAVWLVCLIRQGNLRQAGFIGPVVTAFATISLVLITGLYVLYTKELAEEAERARVQENQPYFAISFADAARGEVGPPVLQNIGNGPATELELEICIDETQYCISGATLPAGGSIEIDSDDFQDLSDPDADIYENHDQVNISGSYRDVFGKDQCVDQHHRMENLRATAQALS